jgi:hypothetical protein
VPLQAAVCSSLSQLSLDSPAGISLSSTPFTRNGKINPDLQFHTRLMLEANTMMFCILITCGSCIHILNKTKFGSRLG